MLLVPSFLFYWKKLFIFVKSTSFFIHLFTSGFLVHTIFLTCSISTSITMTKEYDHLFKLLIIGDSGKVFHRIHTHLKTVVNYTLSCISVELVGGFE